MRVRPYRTVEDKIDGVVITFVDVSDRRQIEEQLRESEREVRRLKGK
jgi:two-component system CheB/CheR fusion protein